MRRAAVELPDTRTLWLDFSAPRARSQEAARSVEGGAATLRARVLDLLRRVGPLTDEEMQERLPMPPNTQRPRRLELVAGGLVEDSGTTRPTRSGRQATVWRAR